MEESGTELEAEAEEGELEGAVRRTCEDMELEEGELAEEGESVGPAEEGSTDLEAEAEEGKLEEGELAEGRVGWGSGAGDHTLCLRFLNRARH